MPDDKTEQATRDSLRAQGIDPDAELAKFRGDLWQRLAGDKPIDAAEAQSIREWLASWPLDAEVVPTARVVLIRMLAMIDLINGAIVALRNAAPAIAALADECAAARDRIATLEAELAQARAHRCGGIVLSAEDADRIAALLEEQPGPTPAMLALFDKAKEE